MSQQLSSSEANNNDKLKMKCAACGKEGDFLKNCSACLSVRYCSSACQRVGWPGHRLECLRLRNKDKDKDKEKDKYKDKEKEEGGSGVGSPKAAPLSAVKRYCEFDAFKACYDGHHAELQKVLEQKGLDINWAKPDDGATAVYAAARNGHDKCLSALVRHGGADLSKWARNGRAPIHAACEQGRIACLRILLDTGIDADVRVADGAGQTPAIMCCSSGHVKCLSLLLDRGADASLADGGGFTPAHYACGAGQLKCVQLLIARRANLNARTGNGLTPLDYARIGGYPECVELLLENSAIGRRVEDLPPTTEAQKETVAKAQKIAEASREAAKRCDYPPCNASAADKNLTALKKCPRCGEGRYCCHVHGNLDWDRHKLLCRDIKLKVEIEAQY